MSEAALIGRNFSVNMSAQLIAQVLAFVISILVARTLGIEQYGIFAFGIAFPSWFLLAVSLGLDSVLTIEVAKDRSKAGSYLTRIAVLRLPLALVALMLLWISVHLILADPFARTVTLLLGIAGVLQTYAGTFTSVFRAFERLEFDALVLVAERVTTATAIILLILMGFDLLWVALAFVGGGVLSVSLSLFLVRRRFVWFTRDVERGRTGEIVRLTVPFALVAVVGTLSMTSGVVLLTIFLGPVATGQFNAAQTLLFALITVLMRFNFVFLPTMSRISREASWKIPLVLQQTQKLAFIFGLPAALGGWFYAEEIVTLFYGEAFRMAAQSFGVLIFALAASTAVLGSGAALAATGRQVLNLYTGIAVATTTIGLHLALIPTWGPVGAAYGFLGGASLHAILVFVIVRRFVARIDPLTAYGKTIVASGAMVLFLYALPQLSLGLGIGLGAGIYFAVLFFTKGITSDDWNVIKNALRGALFRSG